MDLVTSIASIAGLYIVSKAIHKNNAKANDTNDTNDTNDANNAKANNANTTEGFQQSMLLPTESEEVQEDTDHNNMNPYYGRNVTHNVEGMSRVNDSIMDYKTGAGTLYKPKVAQEPLFEPIPNQHYAEGYTHKASEMERSRANISEMKNNELPFEQIIDTPDKNPLARVTPKTTNELRPLYNPKQESVDHLYTGGMYKPNQYATAGMSKKMRPETTFSSAEAMPTTGSYLKPSIRLDPELSEGFRGLQHTEPSSMGSKSLNNSGYVTGYNEPSKKNAVETDYLVGGRQKNLVKNDLTIQSIQATQFENNRSFTTKQNPEGIMGVLQRSIRAATAPITQLIKPTHREDIGDNSRIYGNHTSQIKNSQGIQQSNLLTPTLKQSRLTREQYSTKHVQPMDGYSNTDDYNIQRKTSKIERNSNGYITGGAYNVSSASDYTYVTNTNNNHINNGMLNRTPNGNANMFNSQSDVIMDRTKLTGQENLNSHVNPSVSTFPSSYNNDIGSLTLQRQQYTNEDRNDSYVLNSYKENPYISKLPVSIN